MRMLLLVGALSSHRIWERIVLWRGEALRRLGAAGWLLVAVSFMAVVLGLMRGAGKADNSDL